MFDLEVKGTERSEFVLTFLEMLLNLNGEAVVGASMQGGRETFLPKAALGFLQRSGGASPHDLLLVLCLLGCPFCIGREYP